MKKVFFSLLMIATLVFATTNINAQQPFKIGVFDMDYMVQAMPGYSTVDSLLQIYERDTLGAQYDIYVSEYKRLDSTYKADSALKKPQTVLDYSRKQLQQIGFNLQYWQQISQQQLNQKKGTLAQSLYEQVANAYKKVLLAKNYAVVLKPGAFEMGTHIDNIFISVAKELKLTSLPQELVQLGEDPDGAAKGAQQQQMPATGKPAGSNSGGLKPPKTN